MYVLALSDYKYIFKTCCYRGLQTRPPIRQFTHTIRYRACNLSLSGFAYHPCRNDRAEGEG